MPRQHRSRLATAARDRRCRHRPARRSVGADPGLVRGRTYAVSTRSLRKPESTRITLTKLPMKSDAPTRSTTASATSATTSAARARTTAAVQAAATGALGERGRERGTGSLQRRTDARDEPRHQRGNSRDRQHARIDADGGHAREVFGQSGRKHANAYPGKDETDDGPRHRHDEALDQHALDESAATGAERRTHGGIALLHGGARQPQVRDVRARDEQHDAHGGKEHEHPRPRGAADEVIAKRAKAYAGAAYWSRDWRRRSSPRPGTSAPAPGRVTYPTSSARWLAPRPPMRGLRLHRRREAAEPTQGVQKSAGCDEPGG